MHILLVLINYDKISCIYNLGELGCNFFSLKIKPFRNHTDAYRGLKAAPGYLARAGPYSTSKTSTYGVDKNIMVS